MSHQKQILVLILKKKYSFTFCLSNTDQFEKTAKKTNFMLNRLIYDRVRSLTAVVKCSVTYRSDIDLGKEMKILNDNKQFKKALKLFDTYKEKDIKMKSSFVITQALKACTQTGDIQRGLTIYDLVSFQMKQDSYILASLIHLFSMLIE
jgi:hypothetical protein